MKYFIKISVMLLFINLFYLISSIEIEIIENVSFGQKKTVPINKEGNFLICAKFKKDHDYLYIYPKNYGEGIINKGVFKLYVKEYSDSDKENYINYLESNYSTIDINSGLFIPTSELEYKDDKLSIFLIAYGKAYFGLMLAYEDSIKFPYSLKESNFQINQFTLLKNSDIDITYVIEGTASRVLSILSKTSLRNIDIKVTYKEEDITYSKGVYALPNGYSIFIDRNFFDISDNNLYINLNNKNKKNEKDEKILLGYMEYKDSNMFPDPLTNGYQLYLFGNSTILPFLNNTGESNDYDQYFTYHSNTKNVGIDSTKSNGDPGYGYSTNEYIDMIYLKLDSKGKIKFDFVLTPLNSVLYIQYIDYKSTEISQKTLQPLISGEPKSMLIPSGYSMYHYLPLEKDATNIYYYLIPKNTKNMNIYFSTCSSYPENCPDLESLTKVSPLIDNIGLWYNSTNIDSELQLIYINCQENCSYDIIMAYDNDPLYLYPENNYTKFIDDSGIDELALPVYEYFNEINIGSINIELTIISGKADLILKNGRYGQDIEYTEFKKIGRRQSYTILSDKFLNNDYYKKEIYAIVKQDANYNNTIYNLMYGIGESKNKLLPNNIVNVESLVVPKNDKEADKYTKSFDFVNYENKKFHISISTQLCKTKLLINNTKEEINYYHFLEISELGKHNIKIVINDTICKEGYEEEVMIFAYTSNTNITLSDNVLVKSNFTDNISFKHIFKTNNSINSDNSFNLEIEKLSGDSINFNYSLERISFNSNQKPPFKYPIQPLISKKVNIITTKKINTYCSNLNKNEVCILSITLSSSSSKGSSFSLYLNKNSNDFPRFLGKETLINSINSGSVRNYYFDFNKDYDTEILINSYGQDLEYSCSDPINVNEEGNEILPLNQFSSASNNHKITINKNECSCTNFCKIYIAIRLPVKTKEISSTFSINYLFKKSKEMKSEIELPLNYFVLYNFDGLSEIKYSINILRSSSAVIELYSIKKNEEYNSEINATIYKDSEIYTLMSDEKLQLSLTAGKYEIIIKHNEEENPSYKFRISSIETDYSIIPMLSTYPERCYIDLSNNACYYKLDIPPEFKDDISKYIYFYIPETEESIISIKKMNYTDFSGDPNKINDYDFLSNDHIKRTNWYEYEMQDEDESLLVKINLINQNKIFEPIILNLLTSFSKKPDSITLNYGEKRIFTMLDNTLNSISINIQKSSSINKYKVNLHSVKGNGIFQTQNEKYPLGLDANYKEDISIVVDYDSLDNLVLNVTNEKDSNINEFIFTIQYTICTTDQLLYEIYQNRINSFKFYKNTNLNKLLFYMKANKTEPNGTIYKNISMNIKIYTSVSQYKIKAYVVDEDYIDYRIKNAKDSSLPSSIGEIQTFIQGGSEENGEFTFSKLEIDSKTIENYNTAKKQLYVYFVFSQSDSDNNKVKIDLYPYEMPYKLPYNFALARNELFIQKIPANTNYLLLLSKRDTLSNNSPNMKIELVKPLIDDYKITLQHDLNNNKEPVIENEPNLIIEPVKYFYGKEQIFFNPMSQPLLYLLLNFNTSKEYNFVFKYLYHKDESDDIYSTNDNKFSVEGKAKDITFKVDMINPNQNGSTLLIINAYKADDVSIDDSDLDYLSLNLLFSNIVPTYSEYEVCLKDSSQPIERIFKTSDIKDGGEYLFTCVGIVLDNEREEYFGYKAVKKEIESSGFFSNLIDYIKNHIFATIVIIIIILFIIGIMVNICRSERKSKRLTSVKVELEGQLMDDKNINE